MHNSLVEGKRYKVRLKPLEELLKTYPEGGGLFTDVKSCWAVEAEHHTTNSQGEGLCEWFSKYLGGGLGYATFEGGGGGGAQSSGTVVEWDVDGDSWYYDWEDLKVLGEV